MENENKKDLAYLKWEMVDFDALDKSFNDEQIGKIFRAVMQTAKNGELVEMSDPLLAYPFISLSEKALKARNAYFEKCEINAQNGAKGGTAKATNAKVAKERNYKPPTKKEFQNMAKHVFNEDFEDEKYENFRIDEMYRELQANKWKHNGVPVTSSDHILSIIAAYAIEEVYNSDIGYRLLEKIEKEYADRFNEYSKDYCCCVSEMYYENYNNGYFLISVYINEENKKEQRKVHSVDKFLKWYFDDVYEED